MGSAVRDVSPRRYVRGGAVRIGKQGYAVPGRGIMVSRSINGRCFANSEGYLLKGRVGMQSTPDLPQEQFSQAWTARPLHEREWAWARLGLGLGRVQCDQCGPEPVRIAAHRCAGRGSPTIARR